LTRDGTTTLEPQNSHDPLSILLFRVINFLLFAPPGPPTSINIKLYSTYPRYPSIS
jgi:hypothetical protein